MTNKLGADGSSLPRIDDSDTRGLKMPHVPSYDGHAMNQRGCGDESVTVGAGLRNMKLRASLDNWRIDRKDTTNKRGQNMSIQPRSKNRALFPVTPLHEKNPDLQF